ncbi:MAG: hypothetical protein J6B49_01035 [Phascolarctobacterium sp.]|nr:hypothetical protein [Phascolarctobacterium sp.]
MKKAPYMAYPELQQLMWLSAAVQMMDELLKNTTIPEWVRKFKTVRTYLHNIIEERQNALDSKELEKVLRRAKNTGIKVYSYDDFRVDRDDQRRQVTVAFEDLLTLADAALLECQSCPQGDCVKDCQFRLAFHRLGLQCGTSRENPAPGECEFRRDNVQYNISPQYERVDSISQMP